MEPVWGILEALRAPNQEMDVTFGLSMKFWGGRWQNMKIDIFKVAWHKIAPWHNLLYTSPTLIRSKPSKACKYSVCENTRFPRTFGFNRFWKITAPFPEVDQPIIFRPISVSWGVRIWRISRERRACACERNHIAVCFVHSDGRHRWVRRIHNRWNIVRIHNL